MLKDCDQDWPFVVPFLQIKGVLSSYSCPCSKIVSVKQKWENFWEMKTSFSIESQNHRMVGVGRDLCGSSPTSLPKQGHLQQAAQDLVQAGLEYLQRRRLHSLSGQPVPVLHHPQSEAVLPHVQMEHFNKTSTTSLREHVKAESTKNRCVSTHHVNIMHT